MDSWTPINRTMEKVSTTTAYSRHATGSANKITEFLVFRQPALVLPFWLDVLLCASSAETKHSECAGLDTPGGYVFFTNTASCRAADY